MVDALAGSATIGIPTGAVSGLRRARRRRPAWRRRHPRRARAQAREAPASARGAHRRWREAHLLRPPRPRGAEHRREARARPRRARRRRLRRRASEHARERAPVPLASPTAEARADAAARMAPQERRQAQERRSASGRRGDSRGAAARGASVTRGLNATPRHECGRDLCRARGREPQPLPAAASRERGARARGGRGPPLRARPGERDQDNGGRQTAAARRRARDVSTLAVPARPRRSVRHPRERRREPDARRPRLASARRCLLERQDGDPPLAERPRRSNASGDPHGSGASLRCCAQRRGARREWRPPPQDRRFRDPDV